jgi:NodT family efflux transporter outer membrane factor (OMF) lipoprotein
MLIRCVLVLSFAAAASACTLGPDYKRPVVAAPERFRAAASGEATSLGDLQWVELFDDPALSQLVGTALAQNFDLRIAAERVLQARAAYGIARADEWPSVGASAEVVGTRLSQAGANRGVRPGDDADVAYTQVGFVVGWELDVWGRLRRLSEAARAEYLATQEAQRGVVTTLVADVTSTYLALRALDLQQEIAVRTRDIAGDALRLTQARSDRGVATDLDVRQAEQLLYTARGQLASIEREIAVTEHLLTLLLGQVPGDVPRGQSLEAFRTPPAIPAGLPSALLERRPDIRRAEQELIAANARIGAARAELFPRISLTGLLGVQSRALSDLLTGPARTWTAAAGATAPLFDAGRTRGSIRLAEGVQRELVLRYQQAIYNAFREVSDALATHARASEERAEQERLIGALQASVRLSTRRYEGGVDNYLQVLDAQRNLFRGELDLARLRLREVTAVVELYRALGGGWDRAGAPHAARGGL